MKKGHILLVYKNFSNDSSISHIGLGVTAAYTAKTLQDDGWLALPKAIFNAAELRKYIVLNRRRKPVTHVILMAQWLKTADIASLCIDFPETHFAQKCHSNVGFLQAEPPAITLLRGALDLETGLANFSAAANNIRLCKAIEAMYGRPMTYLPNLYWTHGKEPIHRPLYNGGMLRIGCFGSLRVYKNFSTAIAAAVELTTQMKVHSEIWINAGRTDGGGDSKKNVVYRTALAWTQGLPHVTLRELHWASWPEFKRVIGSMNILFQPSYTETFNNVSADGVVEGVPSVVGPSIEWLPDAWKAEPDDSSAVAGVARRLLYDHYAADQGYKHLKDYVRRGLPYWREFLSKGI